MSKRNIRRRDSDSDDQEEKETESLSNLINDIRDVQKARKKPPGLNVSDMLESSSGQQQQQTTSSEKDPFKMKTGGFIDMRKMKRAEMKETDIEDGIKQTFSKESNLRDEDAEMRKYVEEQLSKKKGVVNDILEKTIVIKPSQNIEDRLFAMPARLKHTKTAKNEEMLSNQMLCGIPEVDLGIEAKIRNIEETEAAKLRLLKETMEKQKDLAEKLTARQNLAKDLSKSYVQHSIYKIDETTLIGSESIRAKPKRPKTGPVPVVDDDTPKWIEDGHTVERPADIVEQMMSKVKRPNTGKPSSTVEKSSTKKLQRFPTESIVRTNL